MLGQIDEFSFVLATVGLTAGIINEVAYVIRNWKIEALFVRAGDDVIITARRK